MLGCSRDHLMGLVNDGAIDFVDIARPGSMHREIRFTWAHLETFTAKRSRRMQQKSNSAPEPKSWRINRTQGEGASTFRGALDTAKLTKDGLAKR